MLSRNLLTFGMLFLGVTNVSAGGAFDHSLYDDVVKKYVDKNGWVDYASLKKNSDKLDRYIAQLARVPLNRLGRDERLATLINAYNAFTLKLILEYYPVKSIMDIPKERRWDHARWNIGGNIWNLNQIEHQQIRAKFSEPRIHFALVCAAVGCPPLRNEAYTGAKLEKQLAAQAKYVHQHETWFRMAGRNVQLTKLYLWYSNDFKRGDGSVLTFVSHYSPELRTAMQNGFILRVSWLEYDWRLNSVSNKQAR